MSTVHFGIVENRNDPQRLGRCQVRVVDLMTHDKTILPTEDLPWANVLQPVGSGNTVAPPNGTQVMVMYIDEPYCQMPIVVGQVPSLPQQDNVFIDQWPGRPKVIDINEGITPVSIPANDQERSNRANNEIDTSSKSTQSTQDQKSNGLVNTKQETYASVKDATSGTNAIVSGVKQTTGAAVAAGEGILSTTSKFTSDGIDKIEQIITESQKSSSFNILQQASNDKISLMQLASDKGAFKSANSLNPEAQKISATFGRANPNSTQKVIEKGNESGSWLDSLTEMYNTAMSGIAPTLKSVMGGSSDIAGLCGDVGGLVGEVCGNLNGLGITNSKIDDILASSKSVQNGVDYFTNYANKGTQYFSKFENVQVKNISNQQKLDTSNVENQIAKALPNLSVNEMQAAVDGIHSLQSYTAIPGTFESIVLQGANLENTLSTVGQNYFINNFGDALSVSKENLVNSIENISLDTVTGHALSNFKNAPGFIKQSVGDIVNQVKASGLSFNTARRILETLRMGGGKNVNLQLGFSNSFIVDPLTSSLRQVFANGVQPLLIIQRTVSEIDKYAKAIESTLVSIASSQYLVKIAERGFQNPVMVTTDGIKTASTCAHAVRSITQQLKNVVISVVNYVIAGGEKVVNYLGDLVNRVLRGIFSVLNLGLGFVSMFLNMLPFGSIITNFLMNLISSFIPGVGGQYFDVGVDPSTIKDMIGGGEFNLNMFSNLGNIPNIAKSGVNSVTSAMFAQVGEGNTPPINGEWGGPNFGGTTQPTPNQATIDVSNTPSGTNRSINATLPSIGGIVPQNSKKAEELLKEVAENLELPNLETKAALLAAAYAYCQFEPRVANYDYDSVGLIAKFPKTFTNATPDILEKYTNAQSLNKMSAEEFYNYVYSSSGQGQALGNVAGSDGYKYADYGLIPIIGKFEYSNYGKILEEEGWKGFENNNLLLIEVASKKFNNLMQGVPYGNHNAVLQKTIAELTGIVDPYVVTKAFEHFYGASTFESIRVTDKTAGVDNPNSYYGSLENNNNPDIGFQDPSGKYPYARERYESTIDKLSRGESTNTIVTLKDSKRTFGIKNADGTTWNQPQSGYAAEYPYNHVKATESGHVQEFDDTPGNERIHTYHRSGTFEEITANGNKVIKIVGDGYTIYDRNGFISIAGSANVSVSGNININCESDANINVSGSTTIKSHGDLNLSAGNNLNLCAGEAVRIWGAEGASLQSEGMINIKSTDESVNIGSRNDINIYADENMFITGGENVYVNGSENVNIQGGECASLVSDNDAFVTGANLDLHGSTCSRLYGGVYTDVTSDTDIRVSSGVNLNIYSGLDMAMTSGGTFDQKTTGYHHVSAGNLEMQSLAAASLSATGTLNLSALGAAQLSAAGSLAIESKGIASLTSVGSVGINGATVMLNSGVIVPTIPYVHTPVFVASDGECAMTGPDAPVGTKALSFGMVPIAKDRPKYPILPPLEIKSRETTKEQVIETPEQANSPAGQIIIANSLISNGYPTTDNVNTTSATEYCPADNKVYGDRIQRQPIPDEYIVNCNCGRYTASTKLSNHFVLGNFFDGGFNQRHKLHDQCGLTVSQIVANLSFLANNVLENILDLLPNGIQGFGKLWRLTSGYRDAGNNAKGSSNKSQHLRGQAIDLQVGGFTNAQSLELARAIAAKVEFDQMILEYSSNTGKCWIHISCTNKDTQRFDKKTMCPKGGRCTYMAGFRLLTRKGSTFA